MIKVTKSLIPPLTNISSNFILFVYIKFTTLKLQYRQKALILSIFDHNYWKKLNFWFKRPQKQNSLKYLSCFDSQNISVYKEVRTIKFLFSLVIFLLFKFVFIKICQINLVLAENSDFLIFFTPSGCNNIGIRKFKPVAKTQFFFLDCEKRMKQNQSLEKSQRLFFFFFWSTFILVHENNLEVCYDLSNFWRDPSENQKLLNFQFHWRSGGVQ